MIRSCMISLFQEEIPASEKVKDLLTTLLYTSFIIFSTDINGVYYMLILILTIYLIHFKSQGISLAKHVGIFHKYMLGISIFSLISALWARNADYAIEKGVTLFELLIAFSLLYEAYSKVAIKRLLLIVMWSGFLLSIYTIYFVGLDNLRDTMEEAGRMENSFANVNVIGMCCSMSLLIASSFLQKRRNIVDILLCFTCLIVVAASGSRKALVMLVIGLLYITLFKPYRSKKKGISKILTIFFSICSLLIVIILISKFGFFEGTLDRMDGLIASLTGKGEEDSSSMIRAYYRLLGFQQIYETPLLGIGMGNGRLLAFEYTGRDCYLHCNYAEIAANGGIVGLLVVYWVYLKLLRSEISLLKTDPNAAMILLFIILNLILDYGKVSYYSKDTYFILMICCLHIDSCKKSLYEKVC